MKKSKLILSVIAIVFLVSFIFLFHSTNKTHAQSAASCTPSAPCVVSGTAVFTNTATDLTIPAPGYQIYFSDYSGYGGTTGNMTYSASYDSTNGINGYAWSPNMDGFSLMIGRPQFFLLKTMPRPRIGRLER
jgi:hypothetical protein